MANRLEQYDDDEMSEILRLAVHKQGDSTVDLRNRLLAAADELGISHEALAEAETEYRLESSRKKELQLYVKETRSELRVHLGIYVITNIFLMFINLMTLKEDKEYWFPYALLGWGIAVGIHAFVALRKVDWDDEEFQKWRRKREERE